MKIRLLEKNDIVVIVNGFKNSDWPSRRQGYGGQAIKPASIFEQYLDDGQQDKAWLPT